MSIEEFQGWLRGYCEAGGQDPKRIQEEAAKVVTPVTIQPITIPWIQPVHPWDPWYPQPYRITWETTDGTNVTPTFSNQDGQTLVFNEDRGSFVASV